MLTEYNKLVIGVCDDMQSTHAIIEELITEYEEKLDIPCNIIHFYSGKELLENATKLDMLLLDIEMPEMDGIEVAEQLNLGGIEYKIIMLTGKSERFKEAFKIGAFRFVTKPIDAEELYEAIDDVRKCMPREETVCVLCDGKTYEIRQKDIIYIEGNKSVTNIYTKNREYHSYLPLREWEKQLEEKVFFRCHKSYIVNLGAIEDIKEDKAILVTEEYVTVAKRRKEEMRQAFMEYDTRYR